MRRLQVFGLKAAATKAHQALEHEHHEHVAGRGAHRRADVVERRCGPREVGHVAAADEKDAARTALLGEETTERVDKTLAALRREVKLYFHLYALCTGRSHNARAPPRAPSRAAPRHLERVRALGGVVGRDPHADVLLLRGAAGGAVVRRGVLPLVPREGLERGRVRLVRVRVRVSLRVSS